MTFNYHLSLAKLYPQLLQLLSTCRPPNGVRFCVSFFCIPRGFWTSSHYVKYANTWWGSCFCTNCRAPPRARKSFFWPPEIVSPLQQLIMSKQFPAAATDCFPLINLPIFEFRLQTGKAGLTNRIIAGFWFVWESDRCLNKRLPEKQPEITFHGKRNKHKISISEASTGFVCGAKVEKASDGRHRKCHKSWAETIMTLLSEGELWSTAERYQRWSEVW